MDKLYRGIRKFRESYFKKEEEFFKRISKAQSPEVLFITCSDSRVDPALVTQSRPGELFIVRNIGNIIPPCENVVDKNSTAAALEFTVLSLGVTDVIVCGHSNCGAMSALYMEPGGLDGMPHMKEWIRIAAPVREEIESLYPDKPRELIQKLTEKENVLAQIENIQTYPFVAEGLSKGRLYLHGWYYDIGSGHMYAYNPNTQLFDEIR